MARVKIYNERAFAGMRRAGRLAAEVLDMITPYVQPGVTTGKLDRLCHEYIISRGAVPAPLNYRGFPRSICTSINEVVCHGIPGNRRLKKGDILNIDVTIILDGWHGDTNRMYLVGKVSPQARRLCRVTYEAMMRGIEAVRPGATLGDIGHAIQAYVEANGCSVVREYGGHGLGRVFHDAPSVSHVGQPGKGLKLKPGMLFTIEPMVNLGRPNIQLLQDGWTVITRDRSPSAQYEHTVGVTSTGYEIFTLSPEGLDHPGW
ncbi:MAG: type I methionyl aminopeptidase [Anaerolineae bacterium]